MGKRVLLVGSGGREHALAWKIAQSPQLEKLFCAPGNAGIADLAECVAISAEDVSALTQFAKENAIDLVVVGPEGPLVSGITDTMQAEGIATFGPSKAAAEIEGSKAFMKALFAKHNIPSGAFQTFTEPEPARAYIRQQGTPIVVKTSGLAAGKGAIVCQTEAEALAAIDQIMVDRAFGSAGDQVVVEDFLKGEEASFIALVDGENILPLASSQDHKAVGEGDTGLNTGGMGAYSPAPVVTEKLHQRIIDEVMRPTVAAMRAEGRPYRGVLYAGVMIDGDQIKVLEFNARFGDPETQPILARMKSDILPILEASATGSLAGMTIDWDPRAALCVVMAAGGYPGSYPKGDRIKGLSKAAEVADAVVFHAGTRFNDKNKVITAGGRVLGVTALGDTVSTAQKRAYDAVDRISWKKSYVRRDIGHRAVAREQAPQHNQVQVAVLMGSDSDWSVMQEAAKTLKSFGIGFEVTVTSAHRTPEKTHAYAKSAMSRGIKAFIVGAGAAAHLAGVVASETNLPVIGVPLSATDLQGMDALLATVQMPGGIPVATMAIGKAGAKNAAIFAAQILGLGDETLAGQLANYRKEMAIKVAAKNEALQAQVQAL